MNFNGILPNVVHMIFLLHDLAGFLNAIDDHSHLLMLIFVKVYVCSFKALFVILLVIIIR